MKRSPPLPELRNRRISTPKQRKQQHLLDVKVRWRKASQQRTRRLISWACRAILFLGIVAGLYLGAQKGLRRFLWENPYYALAEVRVTTDGTLTKEHVLRAAGVVEGTNIFLVNLPQARANLAKLPQVAEVEIQRLLPNRIAIHVSERKPVAWVAPKNVEDPSASPDSFLIDADGILISPKGHQPEYLHLPVISGMDLATMKAGQTLEAMELKAALDLVRINSDRTRFSFQRIDVSKGYCLVATERNRARITFDLDGIDLQIERLGRLVDEIDDKRNEIRTVNLMVKRNVPVTFMEPTEAAPVTPTFRPKVDSPPTTVKAPAATVAKPANPLIKPFTVAEEPAPSVPPAAKPVSSKSSRKGKQSR